jgi:O-antigen/teichoic acid export membrane protein
MSQLTSPPSELASSAIAESSAPADLSQVILRNSLVATVGQLGVRLLNFLYVILAVRVLGAEGFGQYTIVVSFVNLFSVFFELGLSQYVERSIAQERSRARVLFPNLVVLRLILAVVGSASIVGLASLVGYDPAVIAGVFLLTSTFVLAAFLTPLNSVLIANERFDLWSRVQLAGQVATFALGTVLLLSGQGFLSLLYTGLIVMPMQIALSVVAVRRAHLGPLDFAVAPKTWKKLIRSSLPFALTSLALTYNFNVDAVILGFFRGEAEVGWYNAAYRLIFNLLALLSGFLVALTPSLAREFVTDPARVRGWVRSSIQWMALFSLPVAVGLSVLAPRVVALLYGSDYVPAGQALAFLSWDVPPLLFVAFCGNVTAAVGLERPAVRVYLAAALLNVVLNVLLIPPFGLLGAAGVTVLTDALAGARFFYLLNRELAVGDITLVLAKTTAAAALMGAVVWSIQDLALPLVVLAGALSYGLLATVLRAVHWPALLAPAWRLVHS